MPDELDDIPAIEKSFVWEGKATRPVLINSSKALELINIDPRDLVGRRKRKGTTLARTGDVFTLQVGDAIPAGSAASPLYTDNAFALTQIGTHVYWSTNAGYTAFTTVFSTSELIRFVKGVTVYYRLSNALVYTWDGNTANNWVSVGATNASFPPCTDAIWLAQNRMLAVQGTDIYYSNASDGSTWDRTVQKFTINDGGGNFHWAQEIKQNVVILAKPNRLYELDVSNPNPSFWTFRLLTGTIGSNSYHQGTARIGNDLAITTWQGIYLLSDILNNDTPKPISDEVYDELFNITTANLGLYNSSRNYIHMVCCRELLLVTNQLQSSQFILVCHLPSRRWFRWSIPYTVYALAIQEDPAKPLAMPLALVYSAAATPTVEVQILDSAEVIDALPSQVDRTIGSGQSTNITYQEDSGPLLFGFPENTKNGNVLKIFALSTGANAASLAVSYMIDESQTWTAFAASPLALNSGTAGSLLIFTIPLEALGRFTTLRIRMVDSTAFTTQVLGWVALAWPNNVNTSGT